MNRKIFAKLLPFLLLPCLFLMACTSPYSDKAGTVSTLRSQIKLSYEYCEAGTLYSWTTPAGLKEIADEFYISTLSSLSASSSDFKAKVVDSKYWPKNSNDRITIDTKYTSVEYSNRSTDVMYFWIKSGSKYYNLGKFTAPETNVEDVKKWINLEFIKTNRAVWSVPMEICLNPRRFFISKDSSDSYNDSSHTFTCLQVNNSIRDTFSNDNVSIRSNSYVEKTEYGVRLYDISILSSEKISGDYYLWIEKEDGTWWNLGKFEYGYVTIESLIASAKSEIKSTFTFTNKGTKFEWSPSDELLEEAKRFFISENTSEKTTGSMTCKVVDSEYRASKYSDQVSIKKDLKAVDLALRIPGTALYLWVEMSDSTYYNLGKFTTTETKTPSALSSKVSITRTPAAAQTSTGCVASRSFYWNIDSSVAFNPTQFVVSGYSSYSSSSMPGDTRVIDSSYRSSSSLYNTTSSINMASFIESDGKKYYKAATSSVDPANSYLWVQIETGYWYNLGKIPAVSN